MSADREAPLVTVVIVNYEGGEDLARCVDAFAASDYPSVEILVVDNGSRDGSHRALGPCERRLVVLENPINGYAAAVNFALPHAKGELLVIANNDVFVDRGWLGALARTITDDGTIGCAAGKLLFVDGRINSIAHRALDDFYWEDEGFGQPDTGQYEQARDVEGVCWAAVMFRRRCLDAIAPLDTDYVLYVEDVDASVLVREAGWRIRYVPEAIARHRFHGSSEGPSLAEHFCDRNRLQYVAKFHPSELARAIGTSRFLERGELDALYQASALALTKAHERHPPSVAERTERDVIATIERLLGPLAAAHLPRRVDAIRGRRRMSVAFYDHALHVVGGGQRYGLEMAARLADRYDVTLLTSQPIDKERLERWYGVPLSRCALEILPLEGFDDPREVPDVNAVGPRDRNPFDAVAAASERFDVLVNVNMLALIQPRSPFSIFLCHFPDIRRRDRFAVDDYSAVLANSEYTRRWTRERWGIDPHAILYPPVAMEAPARDKERLILAAARFESGGSKKQHLSVHAFRSLLAAHPELTEGWRLALVGGSIEQNPYLDRVRELVASSTLPIELHVNVPRSALGELYARASLFWHPCGLGEDDPHLCEHFGMTTVEAMQNGCVPIVYDGGGLAEIVEHGESGYRFDRLGELVDLSARLIERDAERSRLSAAARRRAERFSRERFGGWVDAFFDRLHREYAARSAPDPRALSAGELPTDLFLCKAARESEEWRATRARAHRGAEHIELDLATVPS
ncbi:MAG: glycosyltransferase [Sandaracinaceae bacterium]